jgi:hypothetical protein
MCFLFIASFFSPIFYTIVTDLLRRGSNRGLNALGEVDRHVLLKVEVSQLLALLQLEKRSKLGIGVDLATILLILKTLLADVGIDLTSNLGTGKNTTIGLSEELGKFVRNQGGLNETRGGAVSSRLATLVSLVGSAKVSGMLALEFTNLRAKSRDNGLKTLDLLKNVGKQRAGSRGSITPLGGRSGGGNRSSGSGGSSGGDRSGSSSLGLGLLLGSGSGRSSSGRSSSGNRGSGLGGNFSRGLNRLNHGVCCIIHFIVSSL